MLHPFIHEVLMRFLPTRKTSQMIPAEAGIRAQKRRPPEEQGTARR